MKCTSIGNGLWRLIFATMFVDFSALFLSDPSSLVIGNLFLSFLIKEPFPYLVMVIWNIAFYSVVWGFFIAYTPAKMKDCADDPRDWNKRPKPDPDENGWWSDETFHLNE